jgi:hypothetical protein
MSGAEPTIAQLVATILFAIAVLHTFSTRFFQHLAHVQPRHAGLWHLLGEVEVVFGFWALVLVLFLAIHADPQQALTYVEGRKFTEPAFIFVIMVIAASRPILDLAGVVLLWTARILPLKLPTAYYFTLLSIGPLLGSFITEPAAMTLVALLLRERFISKQAPNAFKYTTIGVLFVNISIGGTLTPFAAPPVLMVADRWGWDLPFMLQAFGWKAALAVAINAAGATIMHRSFLNQLPMKSDALGRLDVPWPVVAVHLLFLTSVVVMSHHALIFGGLFLFFLGFTEAYQRYQSRLILREGLLVGFFLAGLVVLGGMQHWWLRPLLNDASSSTLFAGATLLTAITDNAALTYLGSLVEGVSDEFKYSLVAGAVTGGGLTVIANAPNPAGFAILKNNFQDGSISAGGLAAAALIPTLVAATAFWFLP